MAERDSQEPSFRVKDRRHWAQSPEEGEAGAGAADEPPSTVPTIVDEYRARAEAAERKLHDYIAAFKQSQSEQEQFRERLARDVERRVALQFGGLLEDLLESLDALDLALVHAGNAPEAAALVKGVALARERFLSALRKHGVERLELEGLPFDPNVAEAVRVDPVDDPEANGTVTETLRPGYKLGERVLRPARVAVGRQGR